MEYRRALGWAAAHDLLPNRFRPDLLRAMGMDLAPTVLIYSGLRIIGDAPVTMGDGAFLNHDCLLEAADQIVIGPNVGLGYRVKLLTSAHDMTDPLRRFGPWRTAPIVIEEGAWLGADVVVMCGVTIGAGAVVGAGAIVTRDCDPHCLYLGSPARKVKELNRPVSEWESPGEGTVDQRETRQRVAAGSGPSGGGTGPLTGLPQPA